MQKISNCRIMATDSITRRHAMSRRDHMITCLSYVHAHLLHPSEAVKTQCYRDSGIASVASTIMLLAGRCAGCAAPLCVP